MSSVLVHVLILWAVIAAVLAGLWLARRVGVEFGALKAAGVFGFVGAAFGVVVGMTTFFANQHYANFREVAQDEATTLGNVVAMAGSFAPRERDSITRQVYCYATDVIEQEWPDMADGEGRGAPSVEGREGAVYRDLLRVGRDDPRPESWYGSALESSLQAGQARQRRLLLSQKQIPSEMWILIYVGAGLIVVFTFFFHLPGRRMLFGMYVAVILMLTVIVAVLAGLDAPTERPLGLEPSAMRVERDLIGEELRGNPASPERFCRGLPAVPAATSG